MSSLLNMAKDFKEKSQEEAKNIEIQFQSDLKKLETSISDALKASEKKLTASIHASQERMSWVTFRTWIWVLIGLMSINAMLMGWGIWQGWDIAEQRQTLAQLRDQTQGIYLTRCQTDSGNKICARMDQKYLKNTWSTTGRLSKDVLMILE